MDREPEPDREARKPSENPSGHFYQGNEAFFGVFTQCQVYLNGVRLVHDGKVTQQVSDLASQIENNRRRFLHSGDVNFAIQELSRITNSYNQRVQSWESEASRRERNKKNMSGGALAKMKAELSMVRTHIRLATRTLTKLEVELQQISGRESFEATQHERMMRGELDHESSSPIVQEAFEDQQALTPVLSEAERAAATEFAENVNQALTGLIGDELVVSLDSADRTSIDDPEQVEQVWDLKAVGAVSVFLVAGWTVKHPPPDPDGKPQRKQLDLRFWLIPKSKTTSDALNLLDNRIKISVCSRKMDSAEISFDVAAPEERPRSDYVVGFLEKYSARFVEKPPVMLLAQLRNLEWMQKKVVVTVAEN